MNCNIIKDLIPLCSEGLCSEESENQIKEHIKDCEKCRLLYEKAPQSEISELETEAPPQNNIFKKVNKKLKRHRIIDVILILLIAGIICVLGWLSYGQITKNEGCQSFETIIRTIEVRKIANALAEGDAETYVNSIYTGFNESLYWSGAEELVNQDIERIKSAYKNFIEGREVESIKVKSGYYQLFQSDETQIITRVEISFTDCGEVLELDFVMDIDGRYNTYSFMDYNYDEGDTEFRMYENAVSYAQNHEVMVVRGLFENILTRKHTGNYENSVENMSIRFRAEYRETARSGMMSYYQNGFDITDIVLSTVKYDKEEKMCCYDITITGADSKGSAVMTTRLYHDHLGLYLPEDDTINVYSDGCTPELEEALRNYFG